MHTIIFNISDKSNHYQEFVQILMARKKLFIEQLQPAFQNCLTDIAYNSESDEITFKSKKLISSQEAVDGVNNLYSWFAAFDGVGS